MRRALVAAALAGATLGCGGSSHPGDGPRATLKRYFAAVADSRPRAACAELTAASRARLAELAKSVGRPGGGCPATMQAVFASPYGHRLAALRHPKIKHLTVKGGRATADVDGVDTPLKLQRSDGHWRIDFKPSVEADGG